MSGFPEWDSRLSEARTLAPSMTLPTASGKTIWMYSGHTWEQLAPGGAWNLGEVTDRILDTLECLVDGPFLQ